jgi:cytochrome P450
VTDDRNLSPGSFFDPAVRADPYPFFRRLRETDPVRWDDALGGWMVTRYADVAAVLQDPRWSPGGGMAALFDRMPDGERERVAPLKRHLGLWMGNREPDDHARIRGLMNKTFTPRVVERVAPFVAGTAERLIAAAAPTGHMDVVTNLAGVLPVMVIARMLGTPPEDCDRFLWWSLAIAEVIGNPLLTPEVAVRAQGSVQEMVEHLRRIIDRRRGEPPQDDLISGFLDAAAGGAALAEEELFANCVMLLFAGHGTVTVLITITLLTLLRHPDVLARVRATPSLCGAVIDEVLRFDSPCQMIRRVATTDLQLGARAIRAGELVWLMLGSANRDPERYPDPDRFDIDRTDRRHLGYGQGLHYCLGAAMSRLEAEVVLRTVLDRCADLRLGDGPLAWHDDPTARALKSLPVTFRPVPGPVPANPIDRLPCETSS